MPDDLDPITSSTDPLALAVTVLQAQDAPNLYGPRVHERIASGACTRRLAAALLDQTDRRAVAEGDAADLLRDFARWREERIELDAARVLAEERLTVALRFAEHQASAEGTWWGGPTADGPLEDLTDFGQTEPPRGEPLPEAMSASFQDEPLPPVEDRPTLPYDVPRPRGVMAGLALPGTIDVPCARTERHDPHAMSLPGSDPQGWCDGLGLAARELADVVPLRSGEPFWKPLPPLEVEEEDIDLTGVPLVCRTCQQPLGHGGVVQLGSSCSRCLDKVVVRSPTGQIALYRNPAWPEPGEPTPTASDYPGELPLGGTRWWQRGYWTQEELATPPATRRRWWHK